MFAQILNLWKTSNLSCALFSDEIYIYNVVESYLAEIYVDLYLYGVEPVPQDKKVLRGCGLIPTALLLPSLCATGVL